MDLSYVLMSSALTYLELTSGEVLEAGTGLKANCSRCRWSYGRGHTCSERGPAYSSELQVAAIIVAHDPSCCAIRAGPNDQSVGLFTE